MIEAFQTFLQQHELCHKNEKILLAISGGVDSMVMLDLFLQLDFPLSVAHCNFNLRGAESDEDEEFVKEQASKCGLPIEVKKFQTNAYAQEHRISIQMAARDLRYQWFNSLVDINGYDKVAMAHHADDAIETMLLNLIKGTGIAGLRGILPIHGRYIRPLLGFSKHQIVQYANQHGVAWRDDRSNESTKYQRNYLRHEILPRFDQINPDYHQALKHIIQNLSGVEQIYFQWFEAEKPKFISTSGDSTVINLEAIRSDKNGKTFLSEMLRSHHFNWAQIENIRSNLTRLKTGKQYQSATHEALVDRSSLIIYPKHQARDWECKWEQSANSLDTPGHRFHKRTISRDAYIISGDQKLAVLDESRLHFPLTVRSWREGDWFVPLGMKGKKKISDFMIDQKIPLNLKSTIPIVLSGEDIVWVAGYRIDDRYKVTDTTQLVCELSLETYD